MAKKRGRENAYDMVLSLSVVSIFVIIVLAVTWRTPKKTAQEVDYAGAKANAVTSSNWPILVPTQIPKGYEITSARFEAESYGEPGQTRWYIGLTNNADDFISLWESDGPTKKIIAAATNNANCESAITIAGSEWQKCFIEKPETRSFVKNEGQLTTVVSGTASWADLESFINSLAIAK